MTNITREQAICMLYCEVFNVENVKKLVPTIDALKNLEICYKEDPIRPMVTSVLKINAYPFLYKRYSVKENESNNEVSTSVNENQKVLVNKAQVANFLNNVYLPVNPFNEEAYVCKQIETTDILSLIQKYLNLFKNVSVLGKWLKSAKVNLIDSPIKRVQHSKGEKVQVRNLYVLKDEYQGKFGFIL
ncbi:hypothetical protein BDF20DRAFT_937776 [Mycotypha africana]|uniref:uncharacterized protein n=1 Tax=Mycotypha africana TaxID=64632 RepID=UPI002300DD8D|nr:uncharacterized protein BDF20DRAFT_937776 [Mycotypha africana]KAI8982142.1 hypothetical protein BDF20DRAFT_937776 [Mycotypha africana]